jgi:hypothetical protein
MSLFINLIKWAQASSTIQAAEKQAVASIGSALQGALTQAVSQAPDMQAQLEAHAADFIKTTVAGLALKDK